MVSLSRDEKKLKQESLYNKIMWIPLFILLAFVPLLVRLVVINTTGSVRDILNETQVGDVYSNYKSTAIIVLSIIMGILAFLTLDKESIKLDKNVKIYFLGGSIFLIVSFISTILSANSQVAWWGMPDRAEGFVINLCYIFITCYTLFALKGAKNYTYIIVALCFLVIASTIIGAFQYFGYDLFTNVPFIENLILGKEGLALGMTLTSDFESQKVFGTMVHYNYMGSFGAMMVPFFLVLALFIRDKKKKLGFAFITLCAMFLLFGSTSRAGFIGLICSFIVILIIFIKPIVKGWKITVPIIVGLIAVLFVFNAITRGTIFLRIPTLISESIGLFSGSDETFNYLDHIPVRGITYENGKQKIELQEHTLYVGCENGVMHFSDENGGEIEYVAGMIETLNSSAITYTTTDERFSEYSFQMEKVISNDQKNVPAVFSLVYHGESVFFFMEDPNKGVIMIDTCPIEEEAIDFPKTVGFKGKEKLGSARGYIWSRSIPLMKKSILVGYGPDNYALVFPQNDYLGKWWAYDTPNMIIDKAHSLYMGIWINNGGMALIGFLIAVITYFVQSLRLYTFKELHTTQEILGIATVTAVVGYLGAGIFNDSVVSVTPIFCILLGAGMGMNYINKHKTTIK